LLPHYHGRRYRFGLIFQLPNTEMIYTAAATHALGRQLPFRFHHLAPEPAMRREFPTYR
jgi:hypothetical protein